MFHYEKIKLSLDILNNAIIVLDNIIIQEIQLKFEKNLQPFHRVFLFFIA